MEADSQTKTGAAMAGASFVRRIHPLAAAAAVTVILASATAVAAIAGLLPMSQGSGNAGSASELKAAQNMAQGIRPAAQPVRATQAPVPARATAQVPRNVGVVESVRAVSQPGEGSGLGAVAGGMVGAVLGNQVGNGSGKKIMTVAGAAGGAYAGHQIEKRTRATMHWEVSVRMNDGTLRTISSQAEPSWRSGDRVRVVNGALQAA